ENHLPDTRLPDRLADGIAESLIVTSHIFLTVIGWHHGVDRLRATEGGGEKRSIGRVPHSHLGSALSQRAQPLCASADHPGFVPRAQQLFRDHLSRVSSGTQHCNHGKLLLV